MSSSQEHPLFSEAIKAQKLDSSTYRITFPKSFCIGSVPSGGFTASCMLNAAGDYLSSRNQRDTLTAHFEYPSRAKTGDAIISIDVVKLGNQMSTLHLTLWQDGLTRQPPWMTPSVSRRVILAYTTHTNIRAMDGLSLLTGFEATLGEICLPLPDFKALKTHGKDDNWGEPKWHTTVNDIPSLKRWRLYVPRAEQSAPGVLDVWMRFSSGERIYQSALPYALDSYPFDLYKYLPEPALSRLLLQPPPAKKNLKEKDGNKSDREPPDSRADFWFPSIYFHLEAKTLLPDEGTEWLLMRVTSKQIKNGMFDLDILVRDMEGELVALGHQVAMIVSMDVNMAKHRATKASL